MARVEQPVLVIQAERDRQVTLLDASKGRKKKPDAVLATIDGVNHLFVPAGTGDVDEYASLQDKRISPKMIDTLVPWLKDKLHVDAAGAGR